ncbi:rRNA methylase [Halobacteroides halobius DSM 5150]|uniref:rRNA methylase n=1 Tax=Halobacteroides halobius (strain ATCC 35273 / DSM 5150 / MD-1) TaxID=748449 RepID=L0KC77_HALHC|nr:RNA methyltransferase [Halobacteroides halobius]AGB41974.1 rRNA methylase [Halobacteroides halobius DSM 5150]
MTITSFKNEKIKYLRSLYKKKYRRQNQQFVLEGIRIIEEALNEQADIRQIFYSDYLLRNQRGQELLEGLKQADNKVIKITDDLLQKVADTTSPQGILAIVQQVNHDLNNFLAGNKELFIIADRIQDPGNLGTIIRTADAAGASGVITTKGTVSLYNQKVLRATMGSLFRLPVYRAGNLKELRANLKENKIKLVVGDIKGNTYHFEADYSQSVAIVAGNEGHGPREEFISAADQLVKIPLVGGAESLNVAMATGVILYEAVRQRIN